MRARALSLCLALLLVSPALGSDRTVRTAARCLPAVAVVTCDGQFHGAAWVVRADGVLVTCAHVVAGATKVSITLPDGRTFEAQVLALDAAADLALLKIDAAGLPALALCPRPPPVGTAVLTLGHPFGHLGSVTRGIVSGLGRTITVGGSKLTGLVQTDAPFNPGNSGGPLVNLRGEVVGVCSAIRTNGQSLGFCVSAKAVRKLMGANLK